jgi:cell division protein FtsB
MTKRSFRNGRTSFGPVLFFAVTLALSLYFTFAAVQGDFGLFRRAEINAEADELRTRLAEVEAEVVRMENLSRRLSDTYLDVDLLDEQARSVLGLLRADEIVIR